MDPVLKQLKIKSGALKRLQKEYISYEKEEEKQKEKLELLKTQGVEDHDVKKQEEFLEEVQAVLPGCKTRLQDTLNELVSWMNENGDSLVVKDSDEKKDADEVITQAKAFVEQLNSL